MDESKLMLQLAELPDTELIRRHLKEEGPEYILILLKRYEKHIAITVRRVLKAHRISENRAMEDIFQEVFIAASEDETIGNGEEFCLWITRVTHTVAQREARKISREDRRRNSPDIDVPLVDLMPDPNPGPEERAISDQLLDAIEEFMETLPGRRKKIFGMRYSYGYKADEIARKIGTSKGVIDVTLNRLRSKFESFCRRKGIALKDLAP